MGLLEYRVEHRSEVTARAVDDLEDFTRGRLLLVSLMQPGGQSPDGLVRSLGGRAWRRDKQIHRASRGCGTRQTTAIPCRRRVAKRVFCIVGIARTRVELVSKPSSSGPEHGDAEALGGIAQIAILGCKRKAEPHRQLQISGVISRQPFLPREIEHPTKSA